MNYLIYLKLEEKNQGLISERCCTEESIFENHSDHEDEIYLTSLNDTASQNSSFIRNQALNSKKALTIKKPLSKKIDMSIESFREYHNDFEEVSLECSNYNLVNFS